MELITKDASNRFYSQIVKINEVTNEVKPKQIIKIGSLLENLFRTATKNDLASNSKLFESFSRIFKYMFGNTIICKTIKAPKSLIINENLLYLKENQKRLTDNIIETFKIKEFVFNNIEETTTHRYKTTK